MRCGGTGQRTRRHVTGTGGCWADRGCAGTCKLLPTEFQGYRPEKKLLGLVSVSTEYEYLQQFSYSTSRGFVTSSKNEYSAGHLRTGPPDVTQRAGVGPGRLCVEWMEWRAQKREPTSRCLAQYLHDGRPQGRQYRASTCVNRRQSRYRQRQPEVSVALQVHNVHSRWIPESRIQNVTYQVDTCTVSWPLSASVAETPGFPRIPLSQASVKETFFDSCVRASKRSTATVGNCTRQNGPGTSSSSHRCGRPESRTIAQYLSGVTSLRPSSAVRP